MHDVTYHLIQLDSPGLLAVRGQQETAMSVSIPYVHAVPAVWRSNLALSHVTPLGVAAIAVVAIPAGIATWRHYRGKSKRWLRTLSAAICGSLLLPAFMIGLRAGAHSSPTPNWVSFTTTHRVQAPSRDDVYAVSRGWFSSMSDAEWDRVDQAALDRNVREAVTRRYGLRILSAGPLLAAGSVVVTGRGQTRMCVLQGVGEHTDSTSRVASKNLVLLCGGSEPQVVDQSGAGTGNGVDHAKVLDLDSPADTVTVGAKGDTGKQQTEGIH